MFEVPMTAEVETIIIGGGQAGLATSFYLKQRGREHVVLEQAGQVGNAWRSDRWDSFTLITPNWAFRLPGADYAGSAPEGFMARAEILSELEQYVARFHLPVRCEVHVTAVEPGPGGNGYRVETQGAALQARNVVVATGRFQRPRIPAFRADLSGGILQLHSGQYRNPRALPPGAVLVVGSGQSGTQIAEELYLSGRRVYLSAGGAGRLPRRYRGKDIYEWLQLTGVLDRTVYTLPSPGARFDASPQLSGRDGGRSLSLHRFARDGVVLLGRLRGAREGRIRLAPDLKESLAAADRFEAEMLALVDAFIARTGMSAPPESLPELRDGYDVEELSELDLEAAGVSTLIWATGYAFDFGLVRLPVIDADGYPVQQRGVTRYPGLYFVGLPWLHKQKSGLLLGVGEDADFIASAIADRRTPRRRIPRSPSTGVPIAPIMDPEIRGGDEP
jgi:putative flavoprotein involved in K+ transport